jgi:hypothetical protein
MSVKARAIVFVLLVAATLTWNLSLNLHSQDQRPFAAAPPWQQFAAKSLSHTHTQSGEVWRLRGAARIVHGNSIITADEVDATLAPDGTIDYDLRGNVHLTMSAPGK